MTGEDETPAVSTQLHLSSDNAESSDDAEPSDAAPLSSFRQIPTLNSSQKCLFQQLTEDFNHFDAHVDATLCRINEECFNCLLPQKNWEEMTHERRTLAKCSQAVRSAVGDLDHAICELKTALVVCPFRIPDTVVAQNRPDFLRSMSNQQVENLLKRKRNEEFADKVAEKRRAFAEYTLQGSKILPKSEEGIENFIDILTRLSLVSELRDKIAFPDKKALQDVNSFKKWFKEIKGQDENRARCYMRLCTLIKEREQGARASCERKIITERQLNQALNMATEANVQEVLQQDFIDLLRPLPQGVSHTKKTRKEKKNK